MQLSQIFGLLWRRRWVILITLGICLLVTAIITFVLPPVYRTVAVLRVLTPGVSLESQGYISTQYADRLTATYLEVLQSTTVLDQLKTRLNYPLDEDLPDIEIEVMSGTELMEIRVFDSDPRYANEFAGLVVERPSLLFGDREPALAALRERRSNSELRLNDLRQQYEDLFESANPNRNTADTLRQEISLEEQTYAELNRQYEQSNIILAQQQSAITLVQPAEVPERPFRPSRVLNLAIGLAAGLMGGLALAFLFENLDNAIYSREQVEAVPSARVIGQIPRGKRLRHTALRLEDPLVLEGYRWLRANVLSDTAGYRTLLVTSSASREGKSSVTANLAVAIAQSGRSVLLIDADLRRPTLHEVFGASSQVGLSEVLAGDQRLDAAVQQLGGIELYLLGAGSAVERATDLLSSDKMRNLLRQTGRQYDVVLVDSPAASEYADAISLATLVDAVIVVVEVSRTRDEDLRGIVANLQSVGSTIAGVVLNRVDRRTPGRGARIRNVPPVAVAVHTDPEVFNRLDNLHDNGAVVEPSPTLPVEEASASNGKRKTGQRKSVTTEEL
jgi:non-specific protein-tyrosine kinase